MILILFSSIHMDVNSCIHYNYFHGTFRNVCRYIYFVCPNTIYIMSIHSLFMPGCIIADVEILI